MKSTRRTVVALVLALLAALVVALPASQPAMAATPLTNLAHLDWLGDQVTPPAQAGHTTYRIDSEPELGVLWTYADRRSDGLVQPDRRRRLKPDDVNWKQGAFNADDVSRAAVVYLRHWQQTGSDDEQAQGLRDAARAGVLPDRQRAERGQRRALDAAGRDAEPGRRSARSCPARPTRGESYWLARTTWALGEGVRGLPRLRRPGGPGVRGLPRRPARPRVGALQRQTLARYGTYRQVDGQQTPAWLVVDGADASAEAVLGLSRLRRGGRPVAGGAGRAGASWPRAIAQMGGGDARSWPFGAVLPWGRLAR